MFGYLVSVCCGLTLLVFPNPKPIPIAIIIFFAVVLQGGGQKLILRFCVLMLFLGQLSVRRELVCPSWLAESFCLTNGGAIRN